jgi:hypothetical protein
MITRFRNVAALINPVKDNQLAFDEVLREENI